MMLDEDEDEDIESTDQNNDLLNGQSGRTSIAPLTPTTPTDYSLFDNPPGLGALRQRLFDLDDEITMSATNFDLLFPFLDNVYRKRPGTVSSSVTGVSTETYWCRLRRHARSVQMPQRRQTPEAKQRKKRPKTELSCQMAFTVERNDQLNICSIVCSVPGGSKHSHDLNFMDSIKRNGGVMNTARREAVKGFIPGSVFQKMWAEPEKMRDAGGTHLKLSDIRNVQYAWRQKNQKVDLKAHTGYYPLRNTRFAPRRSNGHSSTTNTPNIQHTQPAQPAQPTQPTQPAQPAQPAQPSPHPPPPPPTQTPIASIPATTPTPTTMPTRTPFEYLDYPLTSRTFLEKYLPQSHSHNKNTTHPTSRHTTPHITLTWASSLDSRISLAPGLRTAISGPETKAMTHYLRSRHDAILVGVRTAIADDPTLNCRLHRPMFRPNPSKASPHQPRPIIIDPHARLHITPSMSLLRAVAAQQAKGPWIVVSPQAALHPTAVSILKAHGGEYLMINDFLPTNPPSHPPAAPYTQPHPHHPQYQQAPPYAQAHHPPPHHHSNPSSGLNWLSLFQILHREGITSLMVEGGGIVLSELLHPRYTPLISSVIITIAPTFFGRGGTEVCPDTATQDERGVDYGTPIATRLREVSWTPMGKEDVVCCGKVGGGASLNGNRNGILTGIEAYSATPEQAGN